MKTYILVAPAFRAEIRVWRNVVIGAEAPICDMVGASFASVQRTMQRRGWTLRLDNDAAVERLVA